MGIFPPNSKVRKQEQLQEKVLLFSLVPAPGHLYLGADVLSPPTGHTAHCLQRHLVTVPLKQPCSCSRTLCTYSACGVKLKLLCWDLWPFQFGTHLSAAVCHHSLLGSLYFNQVELLPFLMHAYPGWNLSHSSRSIWTTSSRKPCFRRPA